MLDIVWTSGDPDQAVTELMQRGAQMLVPCGSSASVAAKRPRGDNSHRIHETSATPSLRDSSRALARPRRNATGFSDILTDLSGKLVDLARELSSSRKRPLTIFGIPGGRTGKTGIKRPSRLPKRLGVKASITRDLGHRRCERSDCCDERPAGPTTLIVQPQPVHVPANETHHRFTAIKHGLGDDIRAPDGKGGRLDRVWPGLTSRSYQ